MNVLTGMVIGQCLPRHRRQEFLKFLRTIDREVPKGLQIYLILDNYSTHHTSSLSPVTLVNTFNAAKRVVVPLRL